MLPNEAYEDAFNYILTESGRVGFTTIAAIRTRPYLGRAGLRLLTSPEKHWRRPFRQIAASNRGTPAWVTLNSLLSNIIFQENIISDSACLGSNSCRLVSMWARRRSWCRD